MDGLDRIRGVELNCKTLTGILDMRETFSGILDAFPASDMGLS